MAFLLPSLSFPTALPPKLPARVGEDLQEGVSQVFFNPNQKLLRTPRDTGSLFLTLSGGRLLLQPQPLWQEQWQQQQTQAILSVWQMEGCGPAQDWTHGGISVQVEPMESD